MTDMADMKKPGWVRHLPLALILVVAALGTVMLRDQLTFDALRDNREALLNFRDTHVVLTCAGFVAAYIAIVAFSLPGALIATLTGGFLFGTLGGSLRYTSRAAMASGTPTTSGIRTTTRP